MPLGLSDNLFKRLIAAIALIPPVVAIIVVGGWWFTGLLIAGGIVMILEWCDMTKVPQRLIKGSAIAFILAIVSYGSEVAGIRGVITPTVLILGLPLLLVIIALRTIDPNDRDVWHIMRWAGNGTLYVALPLVALAWLRGFDAGATYVFWTFLIFWATDIGGYFFGKSIGGPKLAPSISPNKTWAGLMGGMFLSAVSSLVLFYCLDYTNLTWIAAVSAVVAVVSQLGDLFESAIKRLFNIKDSGGLIPGHGGILDRVDGLVFAAPVMAVIIDNYPVF